jgi:hypothetical protein
MSKKPTRSLDTFIVSNKIIAIKYDGGTAIPQTTGTYAVTFDVAGGYRLECGNRFCCRGESRQNGVFERSGMTNPDP